MLDMSRFSGVVGGGGVLITFVIWGILREEGRRGGVVLSCLAGELETNTTMMTSHDTRSLYLTLSISQHEQLFRSWIKGLSGDVTLNSLSIDNVYQTKNELRPLAVN